MGAASWGILTPGEAEIGVSVEWCAATHWANLAMRSYRCVEHLSERPYVQYYTYRLGLQLSRASIIYASMVGFDEHFFFPAPAHFDF